MRTVEVRSNIAGDIMNIRRGVVYKDSATVVDELLQNCQRAKATKIDIVCRDGRLVIKDNGVGCSDPQALFEKNTSAWGNEDEAFGEGFFSVFLIADEVRVRSADWSLVVDVLKMIETKDMVIEVMDGLDMIDGMVVELVGEKIASDGYSLRSEAEALGAILPMCVTLNDMLVKSMPLLEIVEQDCEKLIETEVFSAVLRPTNGYSTVEYFYEDRPVRSDYVSGMTGRVLIKKGMVTLKAPDRKEFIYDEKRSRLHKAVDEAGKQLYREFIVTATDDEIDQYEEGIRQYLNVEEYAQYLGISRGLFAGSEDEEEKQEGEVTIPKWVPLLPLESTPVDVESPLHHAIEDAGSVPHLRVLRAVGLLQKLVKTVRKLVYVPAGEAETYEAEIRKAEYLGFTVVYAKNRLYNYAFDYYGVAGIGQLADIVDTVTVTDKEGPLSKKEERFLALMKRVEKHYGLAEGSIRLATLRQDMYLTTTGQLLSREENAVKGLCKMTEGVIYLDRRIVKFNKYRAQAPDYPTVTAHDYKALLRVHQTLAHELAHLLYGFADNTLEHSQAMIVIGFDLADLF